MTFILFCQIFILRLVPLCLCACLYFRLEHFLFTFASLSAAHSSTRSPGGLGWLLILYGNTTHAEVLCTGERVYPSYFGKQWQQASNAFYLFCMLTRKKESHYTQNLFKRTMAYVLYSTITCQPFSG